jgi:transcriptional regulator with PAS, ATPase and Fis domain
MEKEVIKKLQLYMERHGYNQTMMANKLDVATSQLNRWLKTERIGRVWIELLKQKGLLSE